MKLLICLLFIPAIGSSQSYKQQREARKTFMKVADTCNFPNPFTFSYIDTAILSKHALYSRAYQWFATNTTNYNRGLQMQDSSVGKLVLPEIVCSYSKQYRYTVTMDVKEGKYRIVFSDFYMEGDESYHLHKIPIDTIESFKLMYFGPGTKHNYWQAEKLHLQQEAENIYVSLRTFIHKPDDF